MKLYTVVGARPQFIKASVISQEFKKTKDSKYEISETIIHTGQHYDENMSEKFFRELGIPEPVYNLGIGGGTHGENTGRMIELIEKILINDSPDSLLLYGDTDSTLAGSIAASKLGIPIFHIESGLRSFIKNQPEEINRLITDHLSYACFAPTELAKNNLINEGISKDKIFVCGDVMADCVRVFGKDNSNNSIILRNNLKPKQYVLVTIHRAENTNDINILSSILSALNKINMKVIMPIHPRTKKIIDENGLIPFISNIEIIEPQGYRDMAILQKNSAIIITDSGGIQKEAYLHKVPCITLREKTEWQELVDSGWNKLVNPNDEYEILKIFEKQRLFSIKSDHPNFYGDGFSSSKIINFIQNLYL